MCRPAARDKFLGQSCLPCHRDPVGCHWLSRSAGAGGHVRARERRLLPVPADDAAGREEAAGNAVAAPSAGISGYLAAHAVLSLLTGIPPATPGRIYSVNLVALDEPFVFSGPRRADCPDCGDQG